MAKVETFKPVGLEPKEMTPEQWTAYHRYRRIRHQEVRPDDPLTPDDKVEAEMKKDSPFGKNLFWAIFEGEDIVSAFGVWLMKEGAPGWDTNKHLLWGGAGVIKQWRRKGIATLWARKMLEIAREHQKTVVGTGTEEEDGHAFLKWLGAGEKLKGAENRLDFTQVDWEMVRGWVEQGEQKSPDTKMEFYEPKLPEELWEELSATYTEFLNTMPFDDLDHGDIVYTPEMIKDEYERMDLREGLHHITFTREPDGSISGITDTGWYPDKPDRIMQFFTGVRPEERGRGLGKWLKAFLLERMKERYPDARWVVTGNANSNAPMLAINKRLGFKEYKAGSAYQMSTDDLEARLAELG